MTFRHSHRVRYGEVDAQRVVYNAHYLAICDDAIEAWFEELDLDVVALDWDIMLKRAVLDWQGSATMRSVIDVDVAVARWGTTSLDMAFRGTVSGRPVFTASITYVGVRPGTTATRPPPDSVRAAFGEPGDVPPP